MHFVEFDIRLDCTLEPHHHKYEKAVTGVYCRRFLFSTSASASASIAIV